MPNIEDNGNSFFESCGKPKSREKIDWLLLSNFSPKSDENGNAFLLRNGRPKDPDF